MSGPFRRTVHPALFCCLLLAPGLAAADAPRPAAEDGGATEIVMDALQRAGCIGAQACRIGPALLTAGPAPAARFCRQHYSGVSGLGIAATDTGADRDDEIQGPVIDRQVPGETVSIAFDRPHAVTRIVLAHLYNPDMPGDPPETAVIEGFRQGRTLGSLRLTSVDDDLGAFVLEGAASVGAVRRLDTLAGQYVLFDPFGEPVDRVVFTAAAVERGDTADYSLVSLSAVPAP